MSLSAVMNPSPRSFQRQEARPPSGPLSAGPFLTRDEATLETLDLARQVADTPATVLITGESGAGKELVAAMIRDDSGARARPFVAVNCGAVTESLQESEFFGHVKGAFTGATERKVGKLERANGGTIFLDEISEMSPTLQAALLRTLQTGEYSPVGSSETRRVDVRVLAASNRDLAAMVETGSFRRDLYYRLNIIRIELKPLRERKADVPLLVEHFVTRMGGRYGKHGLTVSDEAMRRLVAYDYPGNVRELENALQRAVILARGGKIETRDLPPEIAERDVAEAVTSELGDFQGSKAAAVERFERGYLTEVLMKCGGIVSRASQYSGLSERNFHEKLKRYDISAKSFRTPIRV